MDSELSIILSEAKDLEKQRILEKGDPSRRSG